MALGQNRAFETSAPSREEQRRIMDMVAEGGGVVEPHFAGAKPENESDDAKEERDHEQEGARIYHLFDEPRAKVSAGAHHLKEQSQKVWNQWVEQRAESWTKAALAQLFSRKGRVSRTMKQVPKNMHRVANQTQLVLELIDDFQTGTYRAIPWTSIALLVFAMLYAISPADVIPDGLPLIGQLDDLSIIALATRATNRELRAYCVFKGYNQEDYFRSPRAA